MARFLVLVSIVSLIHTVHTLHTPKYVPFKTFSSLTALPKFNNIQHFQESFSNKAETLPYTLFASKHLPKTCGFTFEVVSSYIDWEIKCVVSEPQKEYITCGDGRILYRYDGAVRLDIELLIGKGGSEYCAAGKKSLAALDELAALVPWKKKKTITLNDISTFQVLGIKSLDRKPLKIRSLCFAVLFSPEFISTSQAPTLGYYGKYGYRHSPESVMEITKAIDIIYKITVANVQRLLDSNQINQETTEKVKEALKRNTEFNSFVGLIKDLYKKAIKLSEPQESKKLGYFDWFIKKIYTKSSQLPAKVEPQHIEELEQTVDDIACFIDFFKNVKEGEIRWAFDELNRERPMSKTIPITQPEF